MNRGSPPRTSRSPRRATRSRTSETPGPLRPLFDPDRFAALLRDLVAWLEDVQVEGVVIGGLAAGILGHLRLTG